MSSDGSNTVIEFVPTPLSHVGHTVTLNNTGNIVAEVICLDDKAVVYRDSLFNPHPKGIEHVGHEIEIVTYGEDEPVNVSIECISCGEVVYDEEIE